MLRAPSCGGGEFLSVAKVSEIISRNNGGSQVGQAVNSQQWAKPDLTLAADQTTQVQRKKGGNRVYDLDFGGGGRRKRRTGMGEQDERKKKGSEDDGE